MESGRARGVDTEEDDDMGMNAPDDDFEDRIVKNISDYELVCQ